MEFRLRTFLSSATILRFSALWVLEIRDKTKYPENSTPSLLDRLIGLVFRQSYDTNLPVNFLFQYMYDNGTDDTKKFVIRGKFGYFVTLIYFLSTSTSRIAKGTEQCQRTVCFNNESNILSDLTYGISYQSSVTETLY